MAEVPRTQSVLELNETQFVTQEIAVSPSAVQRGVRQRTADEQQHFIAALSEVIVRDLPERMMIAMQIDPTATAALLGLGFYGPRDVRRSIDTRSRGASVAEICLRIDKAGFNPAKSRELKERVPQIVKQLRNLELLGVDGSSYFIWFVRAEEGESSVVKLKQSLRELFASYLAPEVGWGPPKRSREEIDSEADDAARRERALARESRKISSMERGITALSRIAELAPQLQQLHAAAHDDRLLAAARAVRHGEPIPVGAPPVFVEMVEKVQSVSSESKDRRFSLLAALAPQLFSQDLPLVREAVQRHRVSRGLIASVAVRATLKRECEATLEAQLTELAGHRQALVSALNVARDEARAEFQTVDDPEAVNPYAIALMELCSSVQRTRVPSDYNANSWIKRGADSWAAEELPKWIALGTTEAESVRTCIERAIACVRE